LCCSRLYLFVHLASENQKIPAKRSVWGGFVGIIATAGSPKIRKYRQSEAFWCGFVGIIATAGSPKIRKYRQSEAFEVVLSVLSPPLTLRKSENTDKTKRLG
jgi:hypothetical protein